MIQAKLKVNEPGDIYEQEANRIADEVMASPVHHAIKGAPPRIQRFSRQSDGRDTAPPSVDQTLASPGRPLERALRHEMEQRFSHDFSRVRVHSDTAAQQSAQDVKANAYTVGHNIVFGADRFAPATHEGRRLLAHELTHVVQQSGSGGIHVDSSNEKRGLSGISVQRAGGNSDLNGLIQRQPIEAPPKYKGRPRGRLVDEEPLRVNDLFEAIDKMPALTENISRAIARQGERMAGKGFQAGIRDNTISSALIFARDAIYFFDSNSVLSAVESNLNGDFDPAKPKDIPEPRFRLPAEPMILVSEPKTSRTWRVFARLGKSKGTDDDENPEIIGINLRETDSKPALPADLKGGLVVSVYMPFVLARLCAVPQPGFKSQGEEAKNVPKEPPKWASKQYDALMKRLMAEAAKKGLAVGDAGKGTGRQGEGQGGGGRDAGIGTGTTGTGIGASTATTGKGRGGDARPKDRDKPDKVAFYVGAHGPTLNVWKGGSHEAIPLKAGEKEEDLQRRVEEAAARQRSTGTRLADGAKETGIVGGQGGAKATAEEIAEATEFTANAAAYPARMEMQGGSGAEVSPNGWGTTITGAKHNFDMILDYAARQFGRANETFARLGFIDYFWQVIDISQFNAAGEPIAKGEFQGQEDFDRDLRQRGRIAADERKARTAGRMEGFKETVSDVARTKWEDAKEDLWASKAQGVGLVALDAAWSIGKALVSAWVNSMTEPENRREIAFGEAGEFLVRCLANPQPDKDKPYDKQTRRATSIAVFPVRVVNVNARALEVTRQDTTQLHQSRALLVEMEKKLQDDPTNESLQVAVRMLKRELGLLEAKYNYSTVEKVTQELADYDKQIAVLEKLKDPKSGLQPADLPGDEKDIGFRLKEDIQKRFNRDSRAFVAWYDYEYHLHDVKEARKKKAEQKELTEKKAATVQAGSALRPRVTFVSEENGALVKMDMILGRAKGSTEDKPNWTLADVTSEDTSRSYDGTSTKPGTEGDVEAVKNAFQEFCDKAEYGRGTIAIEIPGHENLVPSGTTMIMKPGRSARWRGRLKSLVEIAGLVAPYVKGGQLIGRLVAVAGALESAEKLYDRAVNDRLKANFETLTDVVTALAPLAHGATALSERLPMTSKGAYILSAAAKGVDVANEFMMPASFLHDLDKIVRDPSLGGPEREAAIVMLFGRGLRDGTVQYVKVTGRGRTAGEPPVASGAGHEPALPSGGAAGERVTPGKPGLAGVEKQPAPDISHKIDTSDVQPIEPAARKVRPRAEQPKRAASESTTGAAKPEGGAQPRPAESNAPGQGPDNRPATEHNVEIIRRETTPDPSARARAAEYVPMFTNWKKLGPQGRKARVEGLINGYLAREGIPPVAVEWGAKPEGHAQFDPASWTMTLSKDVIERGEISADSFATLVDNAVHETQHTVTTYRGIRVALATERFNPEVAIPGKIVGEAIAANKRKHPDREFDEATRGEALEIYQKQIEPAPIGPVERGEVSREGVLARLDAASKSLRNAARLRREAAKELAQSPNDPDLQQHAAETDAAYQDAAREEREAHNDYVGMVEETASWRKGTGAGVAVAEQIALQLRRDDARREADEALKAEKKARRRSDPIGVRVAARKKREAEAVERQAQADIDALGARAETQLVGGNVVKRAVPLTEREIAAAPKAPKKGYVEKGEASRRSGAPEPKPTQAEKPPASGSVPKTPPVISRYGSRAEFVEAVTKKLGTTNPGRPPGWERVREALLANPRTAPPGWERVIESLEANPAELLVQVEKVMDALQNPKLYGDVLGDAWDLVKAGKAADINDALLKMAEKTGLPVIAIKEVMPADKFFEQVATEGVYWVDERLGDEAGELHGQMTHLLQDLVVNKALGGPRASAEFRQLLRKAVGTIERFVWEGDQLMGSRYEQVPNQTFSGKAGESGMEWNMRTGDYVWRFTYDLFYMFDRGKADELKSLSRLSQPELLRLLLNELADFRLK